MNRRQLLQSLAVAPAAAALARPSFAQAPAGSAADHVIAISLDGVRTQEMFGGLDKDILQAVLGPKKKAEEHPLYKAYWRDTREARREAVMPFLWGTFLKDHASIVGDRWAGSVMTLGNTMRFSYPGYAELMTGVPHDDVIDSNDGRYYPFETVLQFLRREFALPQEGVACFGSWDVFKYIPNSKAGDVFTNAGYEDYPSTDPRIAALNAAQHMTVPAWDTARYDHYTWQFALHHLQQHKPKAMWIGLDETDDWSHNKSYVRVIEYLHRFDGWLKDLWTLLQATPGFAGRTALMIVTDHGRGNGAADWSSHGKDTEGAQYVWAIVSAPHWPARGLWKAGHAPASQSQVAATLASLVGKDWKAASPKAGAPLAPPK
ncbi:hypothetical protein TBR22_A50860 [Luteitalea sp. TBR-22]|uniref:alkaline phosphatase family protein n=1 Tax=Luteitalea sp. TBR-22 TaxID=2802971 RepID=UPI001AF3894B|nr:alkaline phosphatase family protein [Luteitalea sp. TBR-22]BCS35852.1 hypothetical protein TBR22_A50860 [Luteitalea sp. TBR-22]